MTFRESSEGKTKAAILKSDRANWLKVITPFNRDFIDELKVIVPSSERNWNPGDKCWLVRDTYLVELAELCNRCFDEVETDLVQAPAVTTDCGSYAVMFLLPQAPIELIKAAYRILSLAYHPDRGGKTEDMSHLNQAYDEIRKEKGIP